MKKIIMRFPLLFPLVLLLFPASLGATINTAQTAAAVVEEQSPLALGPKTPEGFDDPEHLYFFRYQAYLSTSGLVGFDATTWANLDPGKREEEIKDGEEWLKEKFTSLMASTSLSPEDKDLLAAVWGQDVQAAAEAVAKALKHGDPGQIRKTREKTSALVANIGGASVDWSAIFDGTAPGAVSTSNLPTPLALKKEKTPLVSLKPNNPLTSKGAFVHFLHQKQVPNDALPALVAVYEVLQKASGPEKAETAHLLPTIVRFLNDGKKIVNSTSNSDAFGFAVADDYDKPVQVDITPKVQTADPLEAALTLTHEFQHIYDMYSGRYCTLETELRGFKIEALFLNTMQKDPQLSKKLSELLESDDDATHDFFKDEMDFTRAYAEGPQAFADVIAYGHHYNHYNEGTFAGHLTLREAVDPRTGLQRQISAYNGLLARNEATVAQLKKRIASIKKRASSIGNDEELQRTTKDLADEQTTTISLEKGIAINTQRLSRMKREVSWMDQRAKSAGMPPPLYDLRLPVDKDYIIPGN